MKHDNLEKFILEHRAEFDAAHPPLQLWAAIERELDREAPRASAPARIVPFRDRFKMAVGVAALLVVGFFAGLTLANQRQSAVMASVEHVNPDFKDAVKYYNGQIDQRMQRLASYDGNKEAILQDLAQVDEIMEELKAELSQAPVGAEEQIVANLIKSYRTKIDILEKVLENISTQQQNQSKTQNNEIGI